MVCVCRCVTRPSVRSAANFFVVYERTYNLKVKERVKVSESGGKSRGFKQFSVFCIVQKVFYLSPNFLVENLL